MKSSKEIRAEFIQFFENKSHTFVRSAAVVPQDDPTLLFTNAGMNQFKDVFLGIGSRPFNRAVNSQKCIRVSGKHNDLEEVGHDTYHHTFFEMLGNWSFGDYYKKEAIKWAWELLTDVWKLPKDKLYATVYLDDDEAAELWPQVTDISEDRVLRCGAKDNFWEMGETGPCGPCSEIHIDLGPARCDRTHVPDHTCGVNGDCGRYIELWNLVFIQFNRDAKGELHPLPMKHVDTGMGFERIVSVIQNVSSNYETDLFVPITNAVEKLSGKKISEAKADELPVYQVLADHVRMLSFSIADGALPSNEGRGYVLRRILRRASRYARKLDLHDPIIYKLVPVVVEVMGEAFPEIRDKKQYIENVIKSEEESFNKTLDRGLEIFDELVVQLKKDNMTEIPGEEAFKLYDTYGFPLDLTTLMAEENNLTVDADGFDEEMNRQRARARKAGKFNSQADADENWVTVNECADVTEFVGYHELNSSAQLCKFAQVGERLHVVLDKTPFYAESGGQVGDRGILKIGDQQLTVLDVVKQGDLSVHICDGEISSPEEGIVVEALVDGGCRKPTQYNHTATHLLHAALRKVLGDHVQQKGSLVSADRLRFDFSHFKKIESSELLEIEQMVNEQIRNDNPLDIQITDFDSARKQGAMALFGEKYGDEVRVISIDDFSTELCGGTHVKRTGEIGAFYILQESSIASGIRRIEAITGPAAVEFAQKNFMISSELSQLLNVPAEEVVNRVGDLNNTIRELQTKIQQLESQQLLSQIDDLVVSAEKIGSINLAIKKFKSAKIDLLKQAADEFRTKAQMGIVLFVNEEAEKINFVCAITDDLISGKKLKAGDLVKEVAKITGGGGGGRPHLATAGGKQKEKVDEAIESLRTRLRHI